MNITRLDTQTFYFALDSTGSIMPLAPTQPLLPGCHEYTPLETIPIIAPDIFVGC